MQFRWIEWNCEHLDEHGIDPNEAELVVRAARQPYPIQQAEEKWLVRGPGRGGRLLQVIYVFDPDDTVFVIHARPLTKQEKRRYRRRRKS